MLKSRRLLAGMLLLFAVSAKAEVRLPTVLSSGMVIQRDMSAPFWGWADPGESVIVSGSWNESVKAVAGPDGRWMVKLPTPAAGGPFTIIVKGKNKIELVDVLSGDVWIGSGQSNMRMNVRSSQNANAEIAAAKYPKIRLFKVEDAIAQEPQEDAGGEWQSCSPGSVPGFSATAYYFGRKLHRELNVPIGLVQSAWGGTPISAWISEERQRDDPRYKFFKHRYDNMAKNYSPEWAEAALQKKLAQWEKDTQLWKENGSKGIAPRKPKLQPHPLTDNPRYPGVLYNGMIHPVIPLGIKGAIWYQGEANAGSQAAHYRVQLENLITSWRDVWGQGEFPFYFVQLPNYQQPWTKPIEDGGWPVIREVFMNTAKEVPNTGMAITIDIGEAKDIHPKNKQDVGDRLARLALFKTYGKKDLVWTGPIFQQAKISGKQATITFQNGGAPLAVKGETLKGFAVMDAQNRIHAADAKIISENSVAVSTPQVSEIRAVFYAWAINPQGSNLINEAGLPASPFRFGDFSMMNSN